MEHQRIERDNWNFARRLYQSSNIVESSKKMKSEYKSHEKRVQSLSKMQNNNSYNSVGIKLSLSPPAIERKSELNLFIGAGRRELSLKERKELL
jgi:hypothetical protein